MSNPTFQSIFGKDWEKLPVVMHRHYANRPFSDDEYIAEGVLDVMCKPPILWFAPLMKLMGQIPTQNEKDVPVTVKFRSDLNSSAFQFIRIFQFDKSKPYIFHSRMLQTNRSEVVEIMRFGLCWKMTYLWDGEKVTLNHRGYALRIFNRLIPLPITLFLGEVYAEEVAVDDSTFEMMTHITHPWWGKIYEYKGRFKVSI